MDKKTKKLAIAGILIAVGVVCSTLSIPVGASKCSPVQHLINVLAAVFLGPLYGVLMAFITSLLRNMTGLGSLLAFPGSMCGAFLAGIAYKIFKGKRAALAMACAGEIIGTGVIGGMLSYPVAVFLMGKEAALFTYVVPFLISTIGGTLIAVLLICALKAAKVFDKLV